METYLLVVLVLLLVSLGISLLSGLNLVTVVPTSIFLLMLWVTLLGIFANLTFAVITFPFFGFGLFLIAFYRTKKHKDSFKSKLFAELKNGISPALIIFLLSTYVTFRLSRAMQFVEWDEFTQWGFSVKAMYIFNVLGPDTPTYLNNPQYPPGLATVAYSVMQLQNTWLEGNVFWAYHIILLAILASVIAKFNWRNFHLAVFSFVIALFSSVIFFNTFMTIYSDPLLGLVLGYLLYLASQKLTHQSKWNFLVFVIAISAFILIKEIAIGLVLIPIGILIVNFLLDNYFEKQKLKDILVKFVVIFTASVFSVFVVRFIWTTYVSGGLQNAGGVGSASSAAFADGSGRISKILNSDENSKFIFNTFKDRVVNGEITPWNGFSFTTLDWIKVLFLIGIVSILSHKTFYSKIRDLLNSGLVVLGCFAYLLMLYLSYLTVYSGANAASLTSFERYISSYLAAGIFYFALKSSDEILKLQTTSLGNKKSLNLVPISAITLVILLLLTGPTFRITTFLLKPSDYSTELRAQFSDLTARIQNAKLTSNDRVWIITQHKVGFEHYLLQYELLPAGVGAIPFSIGTPYGPGDIWTEQKMTRDKWDAALNDYDYVLIHNVSESFIKEYGDLFEDPESLLGQGLYKVNHSPDGNLLTVYR